MKDINQVALITGATKGIGKAIALQLAEMNYNLFIVGRDADALAQTQAAIERLGVRCDYMAADLAQAVSAAAIVHRVIKVYGQLDVLINNAGMASSETILKTSVDTWDKIFAVNARAPFLLCQEAIPYLKKSPKPIIINIASVVGFKGYVEQAAYGASKHALTGFTKVLAKEVQADGVKVHLISPGGVNTEMVREMRPDIDTSELIQSEEIAEIVAFIISRKGKGTIDHFYIRRASGLAFD